MATTVKKNKAGEQDLLLDLDGTGGTAAVLKSDNTLRTVNKLNDDSWPLTVATRAKKSADDTVITETKIGGLLRLILDELNQIGIPDNLTLEFLAGVLQIKDGGVATAKLDQTVSTEAVSTATIRAAAVTLAKMASNSVDSAQIVALAVSTAKIALNAVTAAQIAGSTITKAEMANDSVGIGELDMDSLGNFPTHYIATSGTHSLTGGGTSEVETVSAATTVTTGDLILATVKSGVTTQNMVQAAITANDTVTYTFDAAIPNPTVVQFMILKVTA